MFYSSYVTVILCLFLWNIYKPSYSGMQRVWAHLAKVHILVIFEVKRSKNNLLAMFLNLSFLQMLTHSYFMVELSKIILKKKQ